MAAGDFEHLLDQYADVVVRIGANVQAGQRVLIAAPIEAADFVRRIAAKAYDGGARLVEVIWGDDGLTATRLKHAPRDSFDEFSRWLMQAHLSAVEHGDAVINMRIPQFGVFEGADPALLGQLQSTYWTNMHPITSHRFDGSHAWVVLSYPSANWAAKVFPDLPPNQQMYALWDAMFKLVRADVPDPVSAWHTHLRSLNTNAAYLSQKGYDSLHFSGPGTDLEIGLAESAAIFPDQDAWGSPLLATSGGIRFVCNLPTEEVATTPHRARVNGSVRATKPLNYGGALIEDFSLSFHDGCVVDLKAGKGEDVLRQIVETDEGSGRLGEVALVPHSSPISQSGLLFCDTLYDENAASHIALGNCGSVPTSISIEEFHRAGGNTSKVHVDFMIGSGEIDVDGITAEGTREPVMRRGEWAFDA